MITEAIILSIDFTSNTCQVKIPLFETVNTIYSTAITASFACPPGVYNGFKQNDIVWVGFVENRPNKPVVLGKIYQGISAEAATSGSTLNGVDLVITNSATLPFNTYIAATDVAYNTLGKLSNKIKTIEQSAPNNYLITMKLSNSSELLYLKTNNQYKNIYGIIDILKSCNFTTNTNILPVSSKIIFGIYADIDNNKLKAISIDGSSEYEIDSEYFNCINIGNI